MGSRVLSAGGRGVAVPWAWPMWSQAMGEGRGECGGAGHWEGSRVDAAKGLLLCCGGSEEEGGWGNEEWGKISKKKQKKEGSVAEMDP
jgi:hypothetical protein